jgi:hypothetical protein
MEYVHAPADSRSAVQVRLAGEEFEQLENWRRSQPNIPPRSEALRELMKLGLAASKS